MVDYLFCFGYCSLCSVVLISLLVWVLGVYINCNSFSSIYTCLCYCFVLGLRLCLLVVGFVFAFVCAFMVYLYSVWFFCFRCCLLPRFTMVFVCFVRVFWVVFDSMGLHYW